MEVNGQLHTSVALPLGNVHAVSIGCVGTSASLEIWRKKNAVSYTMIWLYCDLGGKLPAFHHRGQGLIQSLSIWDFCWKEWHWDRFLS